MLVEETAEPRPSGFATLLFGTALVLTHCFITTAGASFGVVVHASD